MPGRIWNILLVEDHSADVTLTRKALAPFGDKVLLSVVSNGHEALAFLQKTGRYQAAPSPDLILLDLNMPRMGGLEFLAALQGKRSSWVPIVVLTTSGSQSDIDESYRLGANSYVVKPVAYQSFAQMISAIEQYWMQLSRMPSP